EIYHPTRFCLRGGLRLRCGKLRRNHGVEGPV
ncbi:MAG: hypothetical protein AVDCRST_MAG39-1637, partial [uncultured Sphingomonadaceae bacterium]